MSRPRYNWWPFALNMVRDYPYRKREFDALHEQKITASATGLPGGGGSSRTVEQIALRQLPTGEQEEFEAVDKALSRTRIMSCASERIQVVKWTLFRNYRITDTALRLHISERTVRRYRYQFVALVWCMYKNKSEEEYREIINQDLGNKKRTTRAEESLYNDTIKIDGR